MPRRLLMLAAVAGLILSLPAAALAATPTATPRAFASVERVTEPAEIGVARPGGLSWDGVARRLRVFDAARAGKGVAMTLAGAATGTIAGDGAVGTLRGAAAGRVRTALGADLRGLASNPSNGHLYVYVPATRSLWELDAAGRKIARRDLSGAGLDDVRAVAIAPTADTTDAPGRMAAYLADAGRIERGSVVGAGVYEIALSAPVRATAAIAAASSVVSLVNTINTGAGSANWTPDSPDPSGLGYNSTTGRLIAVDGEVEENTGAGWHDVNGWVATLTGTSTSTFNTVTASPTNKEAVGAAYDPARNELYISKDGGTSRIWVYDASTLAVVRTFAVNGAPYDNLDAEGIGFGNGALYMVDAIDNDLVKVLPGSDGVVGTGGDDVVSDYDLQQFGQDEPEGLDVDPGTGNIWVVSNKLGGGGVPQPMLEVTPDGTLVSSVSIAAADPVSPGGLAIAPPSGGGPGHNIYVADRGLDNNDLATENDGKIYEFYPGSEPPPPPPVAPGDWVGTYGVDGYALGGFDEPGSGDLVSLPNATLVLEQGARFSWQSPTTDDRALESPTGSERRATTWYDLSQLRLRLDFTAAYTGELHLYTADWDSADRRQTITVTDGTTTTAFPLTTSYNAGIWLHVPISVGAGGSVLITADYVDGFSATIAGLFLGGAGSPPPPPAAGEKMTNRSFELDENGDTRPDAWTANAAFTRSSAVAHSGTYSGRHAASTNAGYTVYQTVTGITAGQSYAFSGWLNIPPTTDKFTFEIQMKWRGAGNLGTDTIVSRTTATTGWIQTTANATAPAGATSVRVTMKLKSLNAIVYVDDFSLVE